MPRRNSLLSRLRYGRAWDEWDDREDEEEDEPVAAAVAGKRRSASRRIVVALTFGLLFIAGAAFSATAGDQVRATLEDSAVTSAQSGDGTTTDSTAPTSTDPGPADQQPPDAGSQSPEPTPTEPTAPPESPADPSATSTEPAPSPAPVATAAVTAASAAAQQAATSSASSAAPRAPAAVAPSATGTTTSRPGSKPATTAPPAAKAPAPELDGAAAGVVWLNRALPDPTPPALRLNRTFAANLRAVARANHLSWALLLGVFRAEGRNGRSPASLAALRTMAARLSQHGVGNVSPWAAMFSLSNDTTFADRAVALTHYYRAVGLRALVNGLEAEKRALEAKILSDSRVSIYPGGRYDIESHRVNVRVLAAIEYLADSFGQVTVSCLISGHRLYARPGVISAHIYGLAADISEVGGTPIYGHQQPGGITERAVRDILMLPPEMMPKQVISLLGLGGPSFPLANHYDHIHIGY
jgi:outer membrane biosynthesis protein TonB